MNSKEHFLKTDGDEISGIVMKKIHKEIVEKVWNDKLFVLFMNKRFPCETNEDYIKEWKIRFMRGNPLTCMDKESVRAYIEAIGELYGDFDENDEIIIEKVKQNG